MRLTKINHSFIIIQKKYIIYNSSLLLTLRWFLAKPRELQNCIDSLESGYSFFTTMLSGVFISTYEKPSSTGTGSHFCFNSFIFGTLQTLLLTKLTNINFCLLVTQILHMKITNPTTYLSCFLLILTM